MKKQGFLAIDLGASSGRALLGTYEGKKLVTREISRFETGMAKINDHWHWNVYRFFEEVKNSIGIASAINNCEPVSLGISTWGVDYGLLSKEGIFLGLPFSYRDTRTDGMMERFFDRMPAEELYQLTGIQLLQINSLFQLFAMRSSQHSIMDCASDLLFIPDIFNFLLTGKKVTEESIASTSQLYNPINRKWESKIFEQLGLSIELMQEIVPPGTLIGKLDQQVIYETGAKNLEVIAPLTHDTGSAVAAVPATGDNWAYISSGTWSLLGIEKPSPIISIDSQQLGFTNEGGINSTFRVLKNLNGLWIVQQLLSSMKEFTKLKFADILEKVRHTKEFIPFIDTDNPLFMNPYDMKVAIDKFCQQTEQKLPENPYAYIRCVLESLALKYRLTLDQLSDIHPQTIDRIHIIGGGSKNNLLNQFTANATGKLVLAGPSEATATGNIMVQVMAREMIGSLEEARVIIAKSQPIKTFKPIDISLWEEKYQRYRKIITSNERSR